MTVYLRDSQGVWIAFLSDPTSRDLFNPDGDWIGWFPWGDDDAVTPEGDYPGAPRSEQLLSFSGPRPRVDPKNSGAVGWGVSPKGR